MSSIVEYVKGYGQEKNRGGKGFFVTMSTLCGVKIFWKYVEFVQPSIFELRVSNFLLRLLLGHHKRKSGSIFKISNHK